MSELKAEEVNAIRDLLKTQRLDIEQRLAALRTETQPVGLDLPIGRLSRMDAMQQQEMAAGQQRRIEQELQQIVSALDRLERYRCASNVMKQFHTNAWPYVRRRCSAMNARSNEKPGGRAGAILSGNTCLRA